MKNVFLLIILCLTLTVSVKLQTANEADKAALARLNQRLMEASKAGKLNDSADLAQQTLELTLKVFGNNAEDTAIAYYNLGEIHLAKKDYKKAIENLHKALEIYQQDSDKYWRKIAYTAKSLGTAYGFERSYKAEEYLILSVGAAEDSFGKESKEILPFLLNLRNFYVFTGYFEKAERQFARYYTTAAKFFADGSAELEHIEDEYYCFAFRYFSYDTAKRRIKRFKDANSEEDESQGNAASELPDVEDANDDDLNSGTRIINSKATSLVKPNYPQMARLDRAAGIISVKITIDETGKVIDAKTFCGNEHLRKASEKAALKSKFSPTLLEGKPIKVTGYVIYNFVLK